VHFGYPYRIAEFQGADFRDNTSLGKLVGDVVAVFGGADLAGVEDELDCEGFGSEGDGDYVGAVCGACS